MGIADTQKRNSAIAEKMLRPYLASQDTSQGSALTSQLKHNITIVFFSEVEVPQSSINAWTNTFKGLATVRVINTASNGK